MVHILWLRYNVINSNILYLKSLYFCFQIPIPLPKFLPQVERKLQIFSVHWNRMKQYIAWKKTCQIIVSVFKSCGYTSTITVRENYSWVHIFWNSMERWHLRKENEKHACCCFLQKLLQCETTSSSVSLATKINNVILTLVHAKTEAQPRTEHVENSLSTSKAWKYNNSLSNCL